jgi:GNAT superfamily N-acetyltransferase
VQLQVREARLTDIDRVTGLLERSDEHWTSAELGAAADLLRQLVYLPNATIFVGLDGRQMLGIAVLSIRPSVAAGGLVGALDLLAIEPGHELTDVGQELIKEVARSARNKGCVLLEAQPPAEPAALARLEALGFTDTGTRLGMVLAALRAGAR